MKNYIGVKIVKAESKERNMAPKAAPSRSVGGKGFPLFDFSPEIPNLSLVTGVFGVFNAIS